MLKTIGLAGALVLGITASFGCGSNSGSGGGGGAGASSVNFTALRATYSAPTGSLQASDVLNVGKELSTQESESTSVPTSTSSAPIHVQNRASAPRPMDTPVTCSAATASGISCSCGGGGSFDETYATNASQTGYVEGVLTYNDCVFDDDSSGTTTTTESINGTMSFADYTTAPEMFIYSGSITATITPPGTTITENFNYALINGEVTYSVTVSDGTVLVSDQGAWNEATESGSFTVTDKSGTWTCNLTNGTGTCTGPGGTLNV
jgi:hypothetical protein